MKIQRRIFVRPVIGDGKRGELCIKIGKEKEKVYPLSLAEIRSLLRDLAERI